VKKISLIVIMIVITGGTLFYVFNQKDVGRLAFIGTLFTGVEQYENFSRVAELFPVTTLNKSTHPYQFEDGEALSLPQEFIYGDKAISTETFLSETDTGGLFILHQGKTRFEEYYLTGGRSVNWLSMSVAKSFISALLGIAVEEGKIESIEDPITKYVPKLIGSGYENVRIKDIMQMSSGARWNEDYGDPESDINRMGRIMAIGGSLNDFATTLTNEREPGTFNLYNSTDTQTLGMLLTKATGRSVTDYMQEKLWEPLGMESPAYWMIDDENMEMVFGGLNATARDYAKLGELYRNKGLWNGKQIVSSDWIEASTTPDAPHLMPGDNPNSDFPLGYGYQWWIMDGTQHEYAAIGVYNQFIYVNPTHEVVIVKLSANSDYASTSDESSFRELETIEFFRAIVARLDDK